MAVLAVVVLAVVAGGWLLIRDDDKTATDRVQDVAAAMRNDDMDRLVEILGFEDTDSTDYRFIDWHIGWNSQPVFTDVVETPLEGGRTSFRATATASDNSFYSQALGQTTRSMVSGRVNEDGTVHISAWPAPPGLTTVEAELRTWVEANRPELVDEMFGFDYSGIHFSRRSGELRTEVLDDFLASR
jgi:hypothetical protein